MFVRQNDYVYEVGQKSAWGRCSGGECQPSREFREARFWTTSGLLTILPETLRPSAARGGDRLY